jgi:hypothetical protein
MPRNTDTSQPRLWKDYLNRKLLTRLADEICRAYSGFDRKGFVAKVATDEFFAMELKQRITTAAQALGAFLPGNYSKAVDVLIEVAPNVGGWENWILTNYVDLYGVDDFDDSMRALENLTACCRCSTAGPNIPTSTSVAWPLRVAVLAECGSRTLRPSRKIHCRF